MASDPRFNLVIIHTPGSQEFDDWVAVKRRINALAPDIDVRIANNVLPSRETLRWQVTRPSLVFSPLHLYDYRPPGGKVYVGKQFDKLLEVKRLARAGLPVPLATRLVPDLDLDPELWGEFVIVKPLDDGSHGDNLRLVPTRDLAGRYAALTQNRKLRMLVQRYIDQVDDEGRPFQYRVLTMFGRPLLCAKHGWANPRPPIAAIAADPQGVIAVNTRGVERDWELVAEPVVLELAARAAAAMPEIPCLGLDILRERSTGELFVLETNSGGNTWHFSSRLGMTFPQRVRDRMYAQFGALDRAADLLIEKTRAEAC